MQPEIKQTVLQFFAEQKPGRVLDFPCGTGWLGDALSAPGWDYHPADLYCEIERPNFRAADLQQRFPYCDGEFDYVACFEGIEHVENYHHLLREACRVLKSGGTLIVSTPNPLNIKSRRRYYWSATFYGFPHLIDMPKSGDHIHVTPVNLSFLMAFAQREGLDFSQLHDVPIRTHMLRYAPQVLAIQAYNWLKTLRKPPAHRAWLRRLASWRVCLCDGMVTSFKKRLVAAGTATGDVSSEQSVVRGPLSVGRESRVARAVNELRHFLPGSKEYGPPQTEAA
jgi:SAM-dependent methyltransferase